MKQCTTGDSTRDIPEHLFSKAKFKKPMKLKNNEEESSDFRKQAIQFDLSPLLVERLGEKDEDQPEE